MSMTDYRFDELVNLRAKFKSSDEFYAKCFYDEDEIPVFRKTFATKMIADKNFMKAYNAKVHENEKNGDVV